ncbi:caspase family protein, partial [Mesorhizobium sp. M1C.F.Ca.ET.195.01.1.1]
RNWPHDPDEARRTSNDLEELVADERSWSNLLLAYATSATRDAGDGAKGMGSAFSNALCRHLLDHSLTVDECFRRVSQDVVAQRNDQQPWTYS